MYKIIINPNDSELVDEIKEKLKDNGGYCPCRTVKDDDTKCMCKEFRDMIKRDDKFGECHCGLYVKVKVDE